MVNIDRNGVRIERYESLVSIKEGFLEIKYKGGLVQIYGDGLKVIAMNEDELVCGGKIREVLFL